MTALSEAFDAFDRAGLSEEQANTIMDLMTATDENGYIDKYAIMEAAAGWDHFQQFFRSMPGNKSDKAARQMWTDLDTDKDGSVSFEEFKIGMQKLLGSICPKQALLLNRMMSFGFVREGKGRREQYI